MKKAIWDFWAKRYHRLWVQKESLKPTREYVVDIIQQEFNFGSMSFLDIGCGPGELINLVKERIENARITGVDFSRGMLEASKKKNKEARHLLLDAENLSEIKEKYDVVACTHSFPYYRDKIKVLNEINRLVKSEGKFIIAFASANNLYDKMVMSLVKLTTGPAQYPSDEEFRDMIKGNFAVESRHIIRESFYMPTISVYVLGRI
ncbi:class I SAM-dependent DNA methyltransferase [Gudongella sp. DL1XJH-153]|uniref:class I SAM-dependent DNA methyltransferase n=1 Tax=Gudongella sp. DL1XJH-153 TaxID=3409804 RepID=UPI003BB7F552